MLQMLAWRDREFGAEAVFGGVRPWNRQLARSDFEAELIPHVQSVPDLEARPLEHSTEHAAQRHRT